MIDPAMITVVGLYLSLVLAIGVYSYRVGLGTPEDYFLASRTLKTLVLLMAVYATNMTAFYMMGIPGQAFRSGIGVYGLVAFGTAFITPAAIYLIGYRSWLVGKRYGYMTPAEIFGERWGSPLVSLVMMTLLIVYTIPYLVTAIIGAGTALESLTRGGISFTIGAAAVVAIVVAYTAAGGMRGTAWTNVFQGLFFTAVGITIFFMLGKALGGLSAATAGVMANQPGLLVKEGNFSPQEWFSYLFISPLAVIAFPHVFVRILAGKRAEDLKRLVVLYPVLVLLTWTPVVYIGLWGTTVFPQLSGAEADAVLPLLASQVLPGLMVALVLAAILAAIMSSMDAMLLTLSQMVTRDLLQRFKKDLPLQTVIWLGRLFVLAVALVALAAAFTQPGTIFIIATFAFTGFALLTPVMIAGLYWRRSNKYGALAGLITAAVLLPLSYFTELLQPLQGGFYPVIPLLVITILVMVTVTLLTPPPPRAATDRFFNIFDAVYRQKIPERRNVL